ncbi:hypothetical protein [Leptothoe sp. PORK10 BA2]|uniref:hypothetical protein n=1 Tax=Leptothoe sp. PORK10 BA2 TaxID=3110254 RepID=UPI002B217862|nr:hypothetical protein [Leptothoe sp. PORK10 BA2]MEA5466220.1 hypothetical protein [Leptothoe sp. PORK10 BA2]
MWIISTILDGGNIEEAIMKAIQMNAQRPSYYPPQGFVLTMLERISKAVEVQGAIEVPVIESCHTS